ncbi:undecaprenyl-phosphate alpha-N-acetylglucosaminyl 1-phosphate transferase, partial [Enterobacter quasiroggenkampii]
VLITVAAAILAGVGVAAEYAHFVPEWVMLALFLLAFFLYGYCIKRAWKVARFIKRFKRRMRRNSSKNTTLTK